MRRKLQKTEGHKTDIAGCQPPVDIVSRIDLTEVLLVVDEDCGIAGLYRITGTPLIFPYLPFTAQLSI